MKLVDIMKLYYLVIYHNKKWISNIYILYI